MKQLLLPALDVWHLFFPDICAICETRSTTKESEFCFACQLSLPFTDHHQLEENEFKLKFSGRLDLEFAMALFYFTKNGIVQQAIHQLKYKKNRRVGKHLGKLFAEKLLLMSKEQWPDYIIPIPIHHMKKSIRGYNQSEVIAQEISNLTNIPILKKVLIQQHIKTSQTKKSRIQRFENVLESFMIKKLDLLRNSHVMILDDVCTTGATLEAAASKLLELYNIKISFGIIALAKS